jgi:hypothetical protein
MTTNQPIAIGVGQTRKFDELLGGQPQDFSFTINNDASVSNPTNFNVLLRGLRQDADLELYRDINGNGRIDTADVLVAQSSQKGMTFDESIQTRLTLPGTYIARVKNASNASTPFSLVLSNTGKAASNLLPLGTQLGTLTQKPNESYRSVSPAGTANTYRFTMAEAGNFNALLSGIRQDVKVNARLIRDTNNNGVVDFGEALATSTEVENDIRYKTGLLAVRNLAAGNYILQTSLSETANPANNESPRYQLLLSNTAAAPNNLLSGAKNAGILRESALFRTSSTLNASGKASNTYHFSVDRAVQNFNMAIRGVNASAKVDVRLIRDTNRNRIVDDGEIVLEPKQLTQDGSINIRNLEGGTYFLQTTLTSGASGEYELLMSNTGQSASNLLPRERLVGKLSGFPTTFSNSLSNNNSANTYHFTMESAGNFSAVLQGIEGNGAVDIRLMRDTNNNGVFDSGEGVAVGNTTSAGGSTSINVYALEAGSYFLRTSKVDAEPGTTNYKLNLENSGPMIGRLLPTQRNVIQLGRDGYFERASHVRRTQSVDTYQFRMTEAGNFNASLSNIPAGANADIFLLRDANNNGIADAGDFIVGSSKNANADEAINVRSLAAGDYFLQVAYGAGTTLPQSQYQVKMSHTGSSPSNLLPVERHLGILGLPLPNGYQPKTHTGSLNDRNTSDTIRFSVAGNRNTRVSLTGLSANADLRLIQDRNNNGRIDPDEIIQVSTSFGTTSETISRPLTAGNYFAQVFLPGAGNTSYTLTVS